MKRFKGFLIWASLIGGAGLSTSAQDVWVPLGSPPWTHTTFQTVGGITYFTHTSWVLICHRVTAGSVVADGTNFFQVINYEEYLGPCAQCECYAPETHVTVLGAVKPGDYAMQVWSWNPALWMNMPFATLLFHVPDATPTLSVSPGTNGAPLQLAVEGVANVQYVLEASSNLTDWTPVTTKVGGPFSWNPPAQSSTNSFYRVRIVGN